MHRGRDKVFENPDAERHAARKPFFELDFPEGVIRFPFEKKEEPRPLWHIAYDLLPVCDILTELGSAMAASFGQAVSCRKGCGVCCCQMVPLSPPEAAIIADVVDHLPPKRKKNISVSFARALEKLEAAGMKGTISDIYSAGADKKEVLESNRSYFGLSIPCPFLTEGACGIYPHRPSRCREYSVLSPSEYCENPFDERIRRLPLTIKLCESLSGAWSSLTGKPPLIIPLVKSLEWVRDNKDIMTLRVYGAEHVAKAILESACRKANKIARERMEGPSTWPA
jgi:Fe-S-cluster containining protein